MLGRMVIPHCPMWRHELDPTGIIDLWSGRILRTISPKQNTQMIPVYGIHPRGEDQAKTAVIGLRERETRTATHPAHCAIDYAPRRWVCFPTLEVLTVENLRATRILILAGATTMESGPPCLSTSGLSFVPDFARSVGLGPISSPPMGALRPNACG